MLDDFPGQTPQENGEDYGDDPEVPVLPHAQESSANKQHKQDADTEDPYAARYIQLTYERLVSFLRWARKWMKRAFQSANFWIAAATVAIAISTGIYTRYARLQWQAMNGQLTAMQGQFTEMQKQTTLTRQQIVGAQQAVPEINVSFSPELRIQLLAFNNGQTAAKDVHARIEVTRESFPSQKIIKTDVFTMDDMPILYSGQLSIVGPNRPIRNWDLPNVSYSDRWEVLHRKQITLVTLTYNFDDGFGDRVTREPDCRFYLFNANNKGGYDSQSHRCDELPYWLKYWKEQPAQKPN